MKKRRFIQCDVFSPVPSKGNGLAVVVDSEGLSNADMQAFAAWTNLAETTFLLPPTDDCADYRVRIFTPGKEMLFAGHPTLGSCAAWLYCGGRPAMAGVVRQECAIGIIEIDATTGRLAFAAPDTRIAALPEAARRRLMDTLDIPADRIIRSARLCNGPEWQVLELASARDVMDVDATRTPYPAFKGVALIGAHTTGAAADYEVRNISPSSGMVEDPITGSLNAAIAQWMYGAGHWTGPVTVAQGSCMGREGRVYVSPAQGKIWIGGDVNILIDGTLEL